MRQQGFTLIEILVVMAVSSVILTGAVFSIYQVMVGTDRSNSQVVTLTDINVAVLAIKKDLLMTQHTDLTDNVSSSANLTWIDYTSFASANESNHFSSYTLSGTELRRNYDDVVSIVGRRITSIDFTQNGRVVSVVITATGPGIQQRSQTLEFSGHIRAEVVE